MTADDVLTDLRANNPGRRFTSSVNGEVVAVWDDQSGRWEPVAGLIIGGQWARGGPRNPTGGWVE